MNYLGVIPARGGSKGIPRKNLLEIHGKPLLHYTCEAALGSEKLDGVLVSTDDEEIANSARATGVDVPFMRPADLAGDTSPMIPVLQHVLSSIDQSPDALVLLQPTSPLRTAEHIDEAIALFESSGADTLVSTMEVPHNCVPSTLMRAEGDLVVPHDGDWPTASRRQDKEKLLARNGPAILIVKSAVVERGALYGEAVVPYVMGKEHSFDIDEPNDVLLIEAMLQCSSR